MKAQDLKNSILQLAMEGKLVPQDPSDEPASVLLDRIREEKKQLVKDKKIKRNNKESFIFRKNNHFYEKIGKNGEPVCIDDEIPFEIPESWEWCRLKSIGLLQTGNTPSRKISKYFGDNIPFIKPADISYTKINYKTEGLSKLGKTKGRFIPKNSVLMVCIGGSRGKCYFNNVDVCCNQQINTITPYLVNYKFLFYEFCSKYFQELVIKKSSGTATPIINKTEWGKLLIAIPPLNEQKRIVQKIDETLSFVNKYKQLENDLKNLNVEFPELLKQSILQEAIQGKLVPQDPSDEPASVLLDRIREEKEQLVKDKKIKRNNKESFIYKENNHFYEKIGKNGEPVCIDEEIPFEIPETWEWCRLNNILTKLTDGTHKRPNYVEQGIPFISVKDISTGEINFSNTKFISKNDFETIYKRCNYQKGDILLSKVGTTGIPVIINTNKLFGLFVSVALLKFNHDLIYNKYLRYLILSPLVQMQCNENTKGVGNKNWVLRDISHTLICLPPLNEQRRIVNILNRVINII